MLEKTAQKVVGVDQVSERGTCKSSSRGSSKLRVAQRQASGMSADGLTHANMWLQLTTWIAGDPRSTSRRHCDLFSPASEARRWSTREPSVAGLSNLRKPSRMLCQVSELR